jgi:hypothetical protein
MNKLQLSKLADLLTYAFKEDQLGTKDPVHIVIQVAANDVAINCFDIGPALTWVELEGLRK